MGDASGQWPRIEKKMNAATEASSAEFTGCVQNGVMEWDATCIGCGEKFKDYYVPGVEEPDLNPVCFKCQRTMEP